jgi:hypothetical protein
LGFDLHLSNSACGKKTDTGINLYVVVASAIALAGA